MRVSELADRAGTTAKTIRFYEAEGILPAPARGDNGYRAYDEDDLCRLRLVLSLRGLGTSSTSAGALPHSVKDGRCHEMAGDLAQRIVERRSAVAAAQAELAHLDAELAALGQAIATGEPLETLCVGKEVSDASSV